MKKLNENGSVLILALMLILLLTLTGLWSTRTSTVNTRISANENLYNVAFYEADGGSEVAAGLLENTIWERGFCTDEEAQDNAIHNYGNAGIICSVDPFFTTPPPDCDAYPLCRPADPFTCCAAYFPRSVPHDILPDNPSSIAPFTDLYIAGNTELSTGGAIQMLSGYEGKGKGSAGGGAWITYDVRSHHRNLQNKSEAVVGIRWRHVL
jgi:hypothetical protein